MEEQKLLEEQLNTVDQSIFFLILLILGNAAAVLLESVNDIYQSYRLFFDLFENISIFISIMRNIVCLYGACR
mgnify:CR=1 FL=1